MCSNFIYFIFFFRNFLSDHIIKVMCTQMMERFIGPWYQTLSHLLGPTYEKSLAQTLRGSKLNPE